MQSEMRELKADGLTKVSLLAAEFNLPSMFVKHILADAVVIGTMVVEGKLLKLSETNETSRRDTLLSNYVHRWCDLGNLLGYDPAKVHGAIKRALVYGMDSTDKLIDLSKKEDKNT